MTMHDAIHENPILRLRQHCLVGYDPASERAEYSLKIPTSKNALIRRFVRFEPDDPEGYDSYKLEYSKVIELLDLLGQASKAPDGLEYFVELGLPEEFEGFDQ